MKSRPEPLKLLSVDPGGSQAGWSYFNDIEVVEHGLLRGKAAKYKNTPKGTPNIKVAGSVPVTTQQVGEVVQRFHNDGCRKMLIEEQFIGTNAQAALRVSEARMRWQVIAEVLKWEIFFIAPQTWKSQMIPTPRPKGEKKVSKVKGDPKSGFKYVMSNKQKSLHHKAVSEASIQRVRVHHNIEVAVDIADSINQGDCFLIKWKQQQLL